MGKLLGNSDKFTDKQVAETLDLLVEHGVKHKASDVHIEPHDRFVLVRYRIDGSLRGVHKLPRQTLGTIMAQLKKLAKLNVQETRLPQEGSFTTAGGKSVRLALMPVYGGEKAVLHLGHDHGDLTDLESLGFWGDGLSALKKVLTNPHGLVFVAGPKRSGISSTLFSLLKDVNSPLLNIATVETSVKHRLPGINQTYLEGGLTVLEGLTAALKQDPNVILLDTIPDRETGETVIHAANTGHLVLAGIHADSSISAILRLRHAGVEPFLLVNSLRAGVGQRLVRRLCPDCRERYVVSQEEREHLEEAFGLQSAAARKRLHELEKSASPVIFGDVKQLNSTAAGIAHLWHPKEGGCESCGHTGYSGQSAIVEVLKNTDGLHKALLGKEPLSAAATQKLLEAENFVPMKLDGLVKALRGQTTAAEVLRAMSSHA